MKKVLILAVALVMSASLAAAQSGGHIGLFSDNPGFSDCSIAEAFGPPMQVFCVHTTATQANTSQFKILNTWTSFPGAHLYGGNLFIGSTLANTIFDGGTVTYVGCKPLPHLLLTLEFFFGGVFSNPCTVGLQVVPDPILPSGQIEVVDCDGSTIHFATGGTLFINGNPIDCPCVVGTEETSWSRIKAMYQ
jgi:hypothetical protein